LKKLFTVYWLNTLWDGVKIMRVYTQLILFISSYTFLFLIFLLRYYQTHLYESLIVVLILIFVNLFLLGYWNIISNRSIRSLGVKSAVNKTSNTLNYLLPYVIAFLGLQLTHWQDLTSFVILMGIVFVVYVQSNLIYINPLLNALGYKFYEVELNTGDIIIVISKKHLKADITIKTKRIEKGLYLMGDS
jgi:hypothetical protein